MHHDPRPLLKLRVWEPGIRLAKDELAVRLISQTMIDVQGARGPNFLTLQIVNEAGEKLESGSLLSLLPCGHFIILPAVNPNLGFELGRYGQIELEPGTPGWASPQAETLYEALLNGETGAILPGVEVIRTDNPDDVERAKAILGRPKDKTRLH